MSLKAITINHQTLPPSLSRAGRVQAGVIIKLNGFGLNIVIGNLNSHREDAQAEYVILCSICVLKYDLLHREAHIWD